MELVSGNAPVAFVTIQKTKKNWNLTVENGITNWSNREIFSVWVILGF